MNNNEPVVLGKIKKGKTGKPLVVLIVFLFAGAIILFLPTMAEYFGDHNILTLIKEGKIIDFFVNHDNYVDNDISITTTSKKIEDKNEPKLINSKTVIQYNNFTLTNFKLSNDSITYDINTSNTIDFDNSNYYLILMQNDKELVTIKLVDTIKGSASNTFKFKNTLTSIVEIKGYIKTIEDYPEFNLSSDETGTASLTCTKDNNTYEYMFNNNLLTRIKETFIYKDNNDNTYYNVFEKYSILSNKINNNGGVSNILETYTGFTFSTDIDLNIYIDKINQNYYSLNTKSNKINFEMKAKGYDCK